MGGKGGGGDGGSQLPPGWTMGPADGRRSTVYDPSGNQYDPATGQMIKAATPTSTSTAVPQVSMPTDTGSQNTSSSANTSSASTTSGQTSPTASQASTSGTGSAGSTGSTIANAVLAPPNYWFGQVGQFAAPGGSSTGKAKSQVTSQT